MPTLPDPRARHPIEMPDGTVHGGTVHLAEVIDHPNIEVGDYSYYSNLDGDPSDFAASEIAPYLYPGAPERLVIGKFCQIAHGVRFITAAANHATDAITTYPFPIFDHDLRPGYHPDSRDTVVGHDVWLGYGALVCPGARIGSGVIVGAGAVVRGLVPDYAVVAGNPASVTRMRFSDDEIARLLALAWWDWPADAIAAARSALLAGDVAALAGQAPR